MNGCYMIGVRREIRTADEKYGTEKQTRAPGFLAAWTWWVIFKLAKSRMMPGALDSWHRVLLEEFAEVMSARVVARKGQCVREMLACELTQVNATSARWLRQLEAEGVTARQSWPPEYSG